MHWQRWFNHLRVGQWQTRRFFSAVQLRAIEEAIQLGEAVHGGEVRFAVEGALTGAALYRGQTPQQRAIDVFSMLRVWDTHDRNGVLIYVLLADHAVEIIADRGVDARVERDCWAKICRQMESFFGRGNYTDGVLDGIQIVNALLAYHYPLSNHEINEQPNGLVWR